MTIERKGSRQTSSSAGIGAGMRRVQANHKQRQPRILIIESDVSTAFAMSERLSQSGALPRLVSSCAEAHRALNDDDFACVILDPSLPDGDGREVEMRLSALASPPALIVVSARDDARSAVRALRAGASDYILKQADYLDHLNSSVHDLLDSNHAEEAQDDPSGRGLLGRSEPMKRLRARIQRAAAVDATVLVSGETGTGKDLAARTLHAASPVRRGPFVAVNCAALSPALFESELFGAASEGSLFLDEIGELPLDAQAKLLHVLEDGRYRRVGDARERSSQVRVIAATNRDLFLAAQEGSFRWDLYYRLDVLHIHAPPLRQLLDDIPILLDHFLEHGATPATPKPRVRAEALAQLQAHDWPGNVRELKHAVARTLAWGPGASISSFDLSSPMRIASTTNNRHEVGWNEIATLLTRHRGRLAPAAQALDISVRTLQRRMRDLGMNLLAFRK
jgi:DNA-binding NtrC family response regulator